MSQGNLYLKDEGICQRVHFTLNLFDPVYTMMLTQPHAFTCPTSHVTKTLLIMYPPESLHIKFMPRASYLLVLP